MRRNDENAEKHERGKRFRHLRTVWQSRTAAQSSGKLRSYAFSGGRYLPSWPPRACRNGAAAESNRPSVRCHAAPV